MKYPITTSDAPSPLGSESQGASAARFVFVSAQLGRDPQTGALVDGGAAAQAARAVANVQAVLADVGLTLEDVTTTTVWLTDMADLPSVDDVLAERFGRPAPARTCVAVSALPLAGARVQIDCVACR
jgi:2-iminobutanoate/2-iminopropanoate deaminase